MRVAENVPGVRYDSSCCDYLLKVFFLLLLTDYFVKVVIGLQTLLVVGNAMVGWNMIVIVWNIKAIRIVYVWHLNRGKPAPTHEFPKRI